jgi:hypothetical protein
LEEVIDKKEKDSALASYLTFLGKQCARKEFSTPFSIAVPHSCSA